MWLKTITFPSGGIAIVDAHPSPTASRPDILELIRDKAIHFACLTHPHADHGRDLVDIIRESDPTVLWHTDARGRVRVPVERRVDARNPNP